MKRHPPKLETDEETRARIGGNIPLHPFCKRCGYRQGGIDSWDGYLCKCGDWAPANHPAPKSAR